MFRFVLLFVAVVACSESISGSHIHGHQAASYNPTTLITSGAYGHSSLTGGNVGAASYNPTTLITSGAYGHSALTGGNVGHAYARHSIPIVSSYSTSIVHPDSPIVRPIASYTYNSQPQVVLHHQIPAHAQVVQHQPRIHVQSSPLVAQGHYVSGHNGNSYAIERSYTGPLTGHGVVSAPHVASAHIHGTGALLARNSFAGW